MRSLGAHTELAEEVQVLVKQKVEGHRVECQIVADGHWVQVLLGGKLLPLECALVVVGECYTVTRIPYPVHERK